MSIRMNQANDELMKRLFAEALNQLGGTMTMALTDLGDHRGRVEVTCEDGIITATFSGKNATA